MVGGMIKGGERGERGVDIDNREHLPAESLHHVKRLGVE
jgi:hypothetical protein